MKHSSKLKLYAINLSDLERDIFNLSYKMQERFVSSLSKELNIQSFSEFKKGKFKLSNMISLSCIELDHAKQYLNSLILLPKSISNDFIPDYENFSIEKLAYEISVMDYDKTAKFVEGYSNFFLSDINLEDDFINLYLNQINKHLNKSSKYLYTAQDICIPL